MFDAYRVADVVWVSVVAFLTFELSLGASYVLLRLLLHVMKFGVRKG